MPQGGIIIPVPPAPPVGGGGPTIAQPLPYTLLALSRYARIMGLNPAHFMRGVASSLSPQVFPAGGSCAAVWPRYPWQNYDMTSQEELAFAIRDAESDIARHTGFWPAPTWIAEDEVDYQMDYDPTMRGNGVNVRANYKSVYASYKRIIEMGQRKLTLIGTPTTAGGSLVYSDEDSDGFYETATLTMATAYTNKKNIKVYIAGTLGEEGWQIRPLRSLTLSGGVLTIVIDSWLLIDPDILSDYPSDDGFLAINIATTANFVISLDVYYETIDPIIKSVQFAWDQTDCGLCGGVGCAICIGHTEDGCATIRHAKDGLVVPLPGVYNSVNGTWDLSTCLTYPEPRRVRLWYRAGDQSKEWLRGVSTDPLSDWWAVTIAWMATARLERGLCECEQTSKIYDDLRRDMSRTDETGSWNVPFTALDNPFGTRKGEMLAWQRINKIYRRNAVALA
jgi:hypothetical protein